jgi:PilZ domain
VAENSENRRHPRYIVEDIQGNVLYTSDIEVLNISINGAAIETARRLEVNREYAFKITYKDVSLSLKGRVVWALLTSRSKKDAQSPVPVYRAGIKFTDVLSEKAEALLKFIEENREKKTSTRLGGIRFKIANAKNVTIDLAREYSVKKISLSGMLVETEYPLALDDQYDIELFLDGDAMAIGGRIAYCRKSDAHLSQYDIGIEFVRLTDGDKELLQHFLGTL